MATDIKLDEIDGDGIVLESAIVRMTASDLILDSPARRSGGGLRRAIVHDGQDGLTINFNGDYPGGVTIGGVLRNTVIDSLAGQMAMLKQQMAMLKQQVAELNLANDPARLHRMEIGIASLAALLNASVVPPWRTREEVENGDEMGVLYQSAADLEFEVVYHVYQRREGYGHDDVVDIYPPPGSVVLRGATIAIGINAEG